MILGHLEQKLCSKCQNPYSAVPSYSAVHTPVLPVFIYFEINFSEITPVYPNVTLRS